ncbi:MAG: hypothetical protein WDA18_04715 [Candidatus Ratteibacteria bacterium]
MNLHQKKAKYRIAVNSAQKSQQTLHFAVKAVVRLNNKTDAEKFTFGGGHDLQKLQNQNT